jgi:hypothetical protein
VTPSLLVRAARGGAVAGAVFLTGCSAVSSNGPSSVVQPTPLSDAVVVSQPYCGGGQAFSPVPTPTIPDCPPYTTFITGGDPFNGFTSRNFTTGGGHRLLVAVEVAEGSPAPELALRRRPDVSFVEDPAVLASVSAAPAGRRWVGYRADEVRFALNEVDPGDVVDATVAIPRSGERPASETLSTVISIGAQVTGNGFGAEYPADRPVDCSEDLSATRGHEPQLDSISCPTGAPGSQPDPTTTSIVPTDAAITTPDVEHRAAAGETATVPFEVAQSGTTPEPAELSLTASTTVPDGRATPSADAVPWAVPPVEEPPTEVPPTTTETTTALRPAAVARAAPGVTTAPATVAVAVPAGTAPGVYDVTLRAADEGGSRSATARIRVPAPPAPVPAGPAGPAGPAAPAAPVTPAAPRKAISATVKLLRATTVSRRTRRVHLGRVTCVRDTGRCTVRTRVKIGGRTIGTATASVAPKASGQVTLRLTRANLRRLIARPAKATTTVSADGSLDIVRTTTVRAKKAPARR